MLPETLFRSQKQRTVLSQQNSARACYTQNRAKYLNNCAEKWNWFIYHGIFNKILLQYPIASHCFIKPTKHEKKTHKQWNLLYSVGIVSRLPAYLEVFSGFYSYAFGPVANILWGQRVLRTPYELWVLLKFIEKGPFWPLFTDYKIAG